MNFFGAVGAVLADAAALRLLKLFDHQLTLYRNLWHRNFRPSSAEIPTASSRWLADRSISSLRIEIFGIEIFGQAQRKALRLLLDGLPLDALESCPAAVMLLSRTVGR